MKKENVVLGIVLALALALVPAGGALAEISQDVTVTATPSFISISNVPAAWDINDVAGAGGKTIATSTTYYSNPLGDIIVPASPVVNGGCRFTVTNTSSVATDLTVNFPSHTGGDASTNVNLTASDITIAPDTDSFVAWSYCTGMTTYATDKVLAKAAGSSAMKSNLAATTNINWGLEYQSQTGAWASGTPMTSTVTITATEYVP